MTKSYTLIRKVLIRPKELKILKKHCLVKSPYGNKALYDDIDWRPITRDDLLIEMLRGTITREKDLLVYVRNHVDSMYDKRYYYWDYYMYDDVLHVSPENNASFEPFGWATLTKKFDK